MTEIKKKYFQGKEKQTLAGLEPMMLWGCVYKYDALTDWANEAIHKLYPFKNNLIPFFNLVIRHKSTTVFTLLWFASLHPMKFRIVFADFKTMQNEWNADFWIGKSYMRLLTKCDGIRCKSTKNFAGTKQKRRTGVEILV